MIRFMQSLALLLALLVGAMTVSAQAQTAPEPDITTQQQADRTIEEYRINGRLYAIRIIPPSGKAYFLYDNEGDGNFQRVDAEHVPVPDWVRDE